jgi:hypothetical protein
LKRIPGFQAARTLHSGTPFRKVLAGVDELVEGIDESLVEEDESLDERGGRSAKGEVVSYEWRRDESLGEGAGRWTMGEVVSYEGRRDLLPAGEDAGVERWLIGELKLRCLRRSSSSSAQRSESPRVTSLSWYSLVKMDSFSSSRRCSNSSLVSCLKETKADPLIETGMVRPGDVALAAGKIPCGRRLQIAELSERAELFAATYGSCEICADRE